MSVNPGAVGRPADPGSSGAGPPQRAGAEPGSPSRGLAHAYIETYRGPHADAPAADASVTLPGGHDVAAEMVSPALVTAHHRLGRHRPVGRNPRRGVRRRRPGGFGPALQIVTDYTPMVMDSVTVLLHRFGVAYTAIMNPVFRVRRGPSGELLDVRPLADVGGVARRHRRGLDPRSARTGGGQQGAGRGRAAAARRAGRRSSGRARLGCDVGDDARTGARTRHRSRGPVPRHGTARTLRRFCVGSPTGTSCCSGTSAARSATAGVRRPVEPARGAAATPGVLPQLTQNNELLVLAQATIPSYLRYGAYPYIVVVREHSGGRWRSSTASSACSPSPRPTPMCLRSR